MMSMDTLKQRLADARTLPDKRELRDAYLDLFNAFARSMGELRANRDFHQGEALLKEWGRFLDEARPELNEVQNLYCNGRQQSSSGYFWESQGLATYFLEGNFVEAPHLLEKAEIHHERAGKLLASAPVPPDNLDWMELRKNTVALAEAERLRVRGMRLLVQGDYEAEAGGFDVRFTCCKRPSPRCKPPISTIPPRPPAMRCRMCSSRDNGNCISVISPRRYLQKSVQIRLSTRATSTRRPINRRPGQRHWSVARRCTTA